MATTCARVHPPTRASWLSSPSSRSLLWPRRRSGTCFVMVTPNSTWRASSRRPQCGWRRWYRRRPDQQRRVEVRQLAPRRRAIAWPQRPCGVHDLRHLVIRQRKRLRHRALHRRVRRSLRSAYRKQVARTQLVGNLLGNSGPRWRGWKPQRDYPHHLRPGKEYPSQACRGLFSMTATPPAWPPSRLNFEEREA
jgi:hypothetical protein